GGRPHRLPGTGSLPVAHPSPSASTKPRVTCNDPTRRRSQGTGRGRPCLSRCRSWTSGQLHTPGPNTGRGDLTLILTSRYQFISRYQVIECLSRGNGPRTST